MKSKFYIFISFYLILFFISPVAFSQQIQDFTNRQMTKTTRSVGGNQDGVPSLDQSQNPTLPNDSLYSNGGSSVPSMMTGGPEMMATIRVHVLGEVMSPGILTVPVSYRLSDVVALANPKSSRARLIRIKKNNEETKVYDLYRYFFNADLRQNPFLENNDVIYIAPASGSVRIEGPVARTGIYELNREKNINEIVQLAGGFTNAASRIHPIKVIRFTEAGEKMVLNVDNNTRDLKNFKINKGDIIVVPDIINNPDNFDYSVETIPGENAFYPTSTPSVFVLGAVNQSGSYPYKSQLKVKDYISYASPLPTSNLKSVHLIRDGKHRRLKIDEKPIPGDILVVKDRVRVSAIVATVSTAMSLVLTGLLLEATLKNRF